MPSYPSDTDPGLFLETTDLFDVTDLQGKDLGSPEFREFVIRLTQRINTISLAVNLKDSGLYNLTEFVNGQTFFTDPALSSTTTETPRPRQVFRKIFNAGALLNAAPTTIAHGITVNSNLTFTRIYGATSDTAGNQYLPLPFVDVSGTIITGDIELFVNGANIVVRPTGNATAFDTTYIVAEFLKN